MAQGTGHFLLFLVGGSSTESWDESSSVAASPSLSSVGLGVLVPSSWLLQLSSFVGIESFVLSSLLTQPPTTPMTALMALEVIGVAGLSRESSVNEVVVLLSSRAEAGSVVVDDSNEDLPFETRSCGDVVVVVVVVVAVSRLLSSEGGSWLLSPLVVECRELPFSVATAVTDASGMSSRSSGLRSEAM